MKRSDLINGARYVLTTLDMNGFQQPSSEWIEVTYYEESGFLDDDGCHWNEWLYEKDGVLIDGDLISGGVCM